MFAYRIDFVNQTILHHWKLILVPAFHSLPFVIFQWKGNTAFYSFHHELKTYFFLSKTKLLPSYMLMQKSFKALLLWVKAMVI